jgi:ribosome-associated translation inhibitor RaiA
LNELRIAHDNNCNFKQFVNLCLRHKDLPVPSEQELKKAFTALDRFVALLSSLRRKKERKKKHTHTPFFTLFFLIYLFFFLQGQERFSVCR